MPTIFVRPPFRRRPRRFVPSKAAAGGSFQSAWARGANQSPGVLAMLKNVASQKVGAQMVSATDGSAFTGAVTVSVTGDAGTQAAGSVGAGACTHEGNGYHTYAPAQAETNYDLVAFTFTGTGAVPATVQVYTLPTTGVLAPTVLGRTLDVTAGGCAGVDWANVEAPTTTLALTGTTIATTQKVDVETVKTQTVTCAAGVTVGAFVGQGTAAIGVNASGHVSRVVLCDTITTYTGDTPQTGDSFARLGAPAGASVSADIAAIEAQTDDIGAAGAGLTAADDAILAAIAALNNLSAAQVNAEVDTAIADARLDELLAADSDIDGAAPPTVGSVFHELMTKTAGSFTYDQTTDSLEALRDRGDAAWTTATGFSTHSAADVVTAIGTGSTLTAVPWNAAWDAEVQSEVQDAIEANNLDHLVKAAVDTNFATTVHLDSVIGHLADAGTTATFDRTTDALEVLGAATAPSAASIADAVWDETLADHLAGGSTGAGLNSASSAGDPWGTALPGAYSAGTAGHIIGNRIDAAVTSRQATIWSSASATVNLSGTTVKAVTDRVTANADQFGGSSTPVSRLDSLLDTYVNNGYLDGNLVAVVSDAFSPTYLAAMAAAHDGGTLDVRNVTGAAASVSALAANSVTAAALAADAGTEIGTAVWAAGTRTLTAGTNIALAKGTGVTGFTDLSAADVRTAVGLASANLDTQMGDLPTNAELATALAAADDATLAAIAALNNLSAAQVTAAVPTAAENAAAVLAAGDVDGYSLEETLKLCLAALAGKLSGAATATVVIRAADDSKARITATCDSSGNRSAITLDETG